MTASTSPRISFLGFGNMATVIAQSIVKSNLFKPEQIMVSSPSLASAKRTSDFQIAKCNEDAVTFASRVNDVIVLAVKPAVFPHLLQEIKPILCEGTLLISIAASISIQVISDMLDNKAFPIIRAMPNIALLVKEGMTGLFANATVSKAQQTLAYDIFASTGKVMVCQHESEINAITAISGSGPAYFFYIQQLMIQHAIDGFHLSEKDAFTLVSQTMLGAAKLTIQNQASLPALIQQVTSKGGTTEAALQAFADTHLDKAIHAGVEAAYKRAGASLSD